MPIAKISKVSETSTVYIWQITEPEEYFRKKLSLSDADHATLSALIPKRRIEWMLPRYLLHLLGFDWEGCYLKDEYGKPYLSNSDMHLSISHSASMFALIISTMPCGIDIQIKTSKIERIQHKFTTDQEVDNIDKKDTLSRLSFVWSAKEAIYKGYGRKQVRFIEDIRISSLMSGSILDQHYLLSHQQHGDYLLVTATRK